ncbi:MAG: hypothetical protein J6L84_00245 [Clostridiales bacterium]|nr:hypothetical protein [Clostridiales bacterium]MBP3810357.1 hypothetical protein [Clostridiales bacterium]
MSLLSDVSAYIRSGETTTKKLGLEIEHFIINEKGVQIDFHEISSMIREVGEKIGAKLVYMDGYPVGYIADEYTTSLEPSCQFEISINPYSDIHEIGRIYNEFIDLWSPLFAQKGYRFITAGNLPLVELGVITPDDIALSPKKRYIFMDDYFKTSGKYGKYMMRASGSTQISIDYSSEQDMVRKLRVLQKISPVLMILMENKSDPDSTLPGAGDKKHLHRIQQWDDIDPDRTGFVPHSFDEDFGYDKMAEVICNVPLILYTEDGVTRGVGSKTALDLVNEGRDPKNIEHIMSMGFFHFRVKKYIEIRVADAVPVKKALGYVALVKGIVYSDSALTLLDKELESVKDASSVQDAVERIMKDGFDAVIYNGKTAAEWSDHLIGIASGNLSYEEKEYLEHVRAFRSDSKAQDNGQRYA